MSTSGRNATLSQILKNKSSFDEEPKKKSREDWRKAKELEEARKAGTAPAAVDEEGKDINPHIPQYISVTPWYYDAQGPTLKHQRCQPEKQQELSGINDWYKRGIQSTSATRFRKGACENCGALTHKKKECMERPRKVGAKYSNSQIAPDEFLQPKLSLDFDGKRDRWAGYDASEHREIVEEYQKIEEAKKKIRAEKLQAQEEQEAEKDEQDSDKDEDKYVDEIDMPGTKVDSKQRITVRNLRIREDTAKYLRNLDPNSAYYDPKTRSMRDNPYAGTELEVDYKGENSVRFTGDTQQHARAQVFAWDAHERGVDVHLLAEPTKLELLKKAYDEKKDEIKMDVKDHIIDRYGGKEHLDCPPPALLLAQSEEYVEYSREGKIIKGQEKQSVRSRYEEDNYPNNHTSVWGSYWSNGNWGYKCCHSFIKNAYCTGEAGKKALEASVTMGEQLIKKSLEEECPPQISPKNHRKRKQEKKDSSSSSSSSDSSDSDSSSSSSSSSSSEDSGEDDKRTKTEKKSKTEKRRLKKRKIAEKKREIRLKKKEEDKLKIAMNKEEESQREAERLLSMDERKRPYNNSNYNYKQPTTEEMEAYQIKRFREEDPMAQFVGK